MRAATTRTRGGATVIHAATVAEAMHFGIVACRPSATLSEVARTMVAGNLHCVAIVDDAPGAESPTAPAIITALDLMAWAKGVNAHRPAHQVARAPGLRITPEASLFEATEMMVDHAVDHLVVVDIQHGVPIGILAALDIARALAHASVS